MNWGRNVTATPAGLVTARDTEDVAATLHRARHSGQHVKALGSGHSFSPIAVTDGIALSVNKLQGIESIERRPDGTALVRIGAGTRLRQIGPALWTHGLALQNMGDIDAQTLGGALSTGTHGTGAAFPGMTARIAGLRLVTADGRIVDCDATTEPDLFAAARLGLGAVGITTSVVLDCVPAFQLEAIESRGRLASALERYEHDRLANDHYEFYWFPHTDVVHTKRNRRLPAEPSAAEGWRAGAARIAAQMRDDVLENGLFGLVNRAVVHAPRVIPSVNRLTAGLAATETHSTGRSYRTFVTPRRVRFREMEYAVPVERIPDLLQELSSWFDRSDHRTTFPVEVRCAAADDVWLSPAHGRPTGYVAVHQYYRHEAAEYFGAFESMARNLGGRPHWGKMHNRTAEDLRPVYPHFGDFQRVRDLWDPERTFANPYLDRVLG